MKSITVILIQIILIVFGALVASQVERSLFMPIIYDDSPDPTATPSPTHTRTPKPTATEEPTPTATPTTVWAEGGNTCVWVHAARDKDSGMKIYAQVPSVCSMLEVDRIEQDGTLLVVRAHRIKTDTWGCRQSDFGPNVIWPPVDSECPPSVLPPDPFTWGDIQSLEVPFNTKYVCGICEECGEPYTLNCVLSE